MLVFLFLPLSISRNFAALSSALEAPDHSAHLSWVSSRFRLPVPLSGRTVPFLFWALRPGMGSLWSYMYVFSRGLSHLCSFLVLKPFSFAALELGAPLSRFLEEALYKCPLNVNVNVLEHLSIYLSIYAIYI